MRRAWAHTTPMPILFYAPETQVGFGAGMLSTWHMPGALPDRPSNVLLYGVYTTRRQTILGLSYELRFKNDRIVVAQDVRYIDWPDRFYGIGNQTRERNREDYTDRYGQADSEAFYRAISHLYIGMRHLLRLSDSQDVESGGQLATHQHDGVVRTLWSGVGPVLLWDQRKGLFWPEGGSFLRFDALFYRPYFGADFSAELYRIDLRHYQPVWLDHVLALRFLSSTVQGDPPFQLLPSLGGHALFRGWYLGRLRDRASLAAEAEYRIPVGERFAFAAFGSVGRVASSVSKLSFRDLHGAGGAGVRFALRKETRANIRLDLAYGDSFYVYFQFKEAF